MKIFYLLCVVLLLSVTSCRTKEGEPGPAGSVGQDALNKQGSISGTLTYVDSDGNPISKPFLYEYYETLNNNKFVETSTGYTFTFERRALKDSYKKFSLTLYSGNGPNVGTSLTPTEGIIDFSFVSIENNKLFSFDDYENYEGPVGGVYFNDNLNTETSMAITNYSFDKTTGRLVFDFTTTYSPYDIWYQDRYDDSEVAVVEGHVDVILYEKAEANQNNF